MDERAARRAAAAATVALAALPLTGAGPRNGDVVGYLWQATTGAWWDRATHAGYVALAAPAVRLAPPALGPLVLDLLSVAAVALAVGLVARQRALLGLAVGVALLPVAPFGEVDPVWLSALAVAALAAPAPAAVALWVAGGVAVSPAALLALPWLLATRRGEPGVARAAILGALAAVAVLTVASHGAWWVGERGVLRASLGSVGRTPWTWIAGFPWLWAPGLALALREAPDRRGLLAELLATAPLLALPADVPGVVVPGLWGARVLGRLPTGVLVASLVAQGACALGITAVERRRIADEDARITAAAAALGDGDGLVAPFSVGARVGWARTGDPYGGRWHPPGAWLRDQRERWCADPPVRVFGWADGLVPWAPEPCP